MHSGTSNLAALGTLGLEVEAWRSILPLPKGVYVKSGGW